MLLIAAVLKSVAEPGDNIAELAVVGTERVRVMGKAWNVAGQYEEKPVWGPKYLTGYCLATSPQPVLAPIALEASDVVRVVDNFPERYVWDVTRKGRLVWSAEKSLAGMPA